MTKKTFTPTAAVAKNAQKGLDLRDKFGHGGTQVGLIRARQLSARKEISFDIIKRMVSYFARHEVDKKAADFGNEEHPSKGYIAWLLWGGDEGKTWCEKIKAENGDEE